MSLNDENPVMSKNGVSSANDIQKMLKYFISYIRHRGFFAVLSFGFNSFREWLWFASHRKTSANLMNLNCIEKDLHNQQHATYYIPSPVIPFCKMIKGLSLPQPSVFVDYGAGKGRAMILAAECGFHKVKGLEFSPSLYHSAQKNLQSYNEKSGGKGCFELIHTDATAYPVKKEDNCFYFFHPFKDHILKRCLKNIYSSLKEQPRQALLIYQINNRENTACITQGGFFKLLKTSVFFGGRFYVYSHCPRQTGAQK